MTFHLFFSSVLKSQALVEIEELLQVKPPLRYSMELLCIKLVVEGGGLNHGVKSSAKELF